MDHFKVFIRSDIEVNGEILNLSTEEGSYIINESEMSLVLQEVFYGSSTNDRSFYKENEKTILIEPKAVEIVPVDSFGVSIDYFFDDEPPTEISLEEGKSGAVKTWLREQTNVEDLKESLDKFREMNEVQEDN